MTNLDDSKINPTEEWNGLFWAYNLPLQMWGNDEEG